MIESRVVWKNLGSRRIGKSLKMELGLGVTSRVSHGAHMVYACTVEIKSMTSGYM